MYSSCITGSSNSLRWQKKHGKLKHATLSMPTTHELLRAIEGLHTTNSLSITVNRGRHWDCQQPWCNPKPIDEVILYMKQASYFSFIGGPLSARQAGS